MQPQFSPPPHDRLGAELLCPSCRNPNLHHEKVEVFEREEDEPKGVHVSVDGGKATVDTNLTDNPSARRHGLRIHFSCEHCPAKPILTLAQHKGKTYVDFTL